MPSEERRHKERLQMQQYRKRLNDLQSAQEDGHAGMDLQKRLDDAEELYRQCDRPEATVAELDGQLVAELSSELSRCVRGAGAGPTAFQPAEFAARLPLAGQDETRAAAAWASLGRLTAPVLPPCPGLRLLYGTLDLPERRQRQQRASQRAPALAAAVAPARVTEAAEPGATPQQINRLENTLKALYARLGRPVGFFEFAYHPTDFGVTVENVFHTAILVNLRKARLFHRGGLPVLEPIRPGADAAAGSAEGDAAAEKHQVLARIDHDSWRRIVKEFGIRKPLIPPMDGGARAQNGAASTS